MVETFLENSDDGMLKLESPILPDKGPFSALRDSLPSVNPVRTNGPEANQGVAPILVNSRATSLALRLGMSTPVPLPVDRLTVPPTDLPASENQDSHSNQGSTSPTASNQTPIVDNQALEMYINMFHAQRNMYKGARKTDDLIVMRAALLQAVSSQELINRMLGYDQMMEVCGNWLADLEVDIMESRQRALARTAANPQPTPSQDRNLSSERTSPQENVEMTYQDPTPAQALARGTSQDSSVHQVAQNSAQSPAPTPEQNHAHLAVQNAMNALNYVGQNLTNVAANAPYTNQMAMNMPSQNMPAQNTLNYPAYTAQNAMNVQNPNSVQNYVAPSQQTHNQPMLEHPRPPQLQQGLPATSHQGGPTSNGRSNRRPNQRTRRDRFHYNRNDPPVHQPPHQQQRAAPYPVQHQPGGNLGRSRRRGRIPQQEDNTAQILEVGTFYLRAERVMGRIQRNERRNNIQRRNHPSQHNRQ
ncbi:hypothetical protein Pst134EA_000695 [Puccinia striiformis f. sp. tritici]|uniref:hypothetical protein n=1 Tax=Puccinia striiformis f. sp. tritici TaxID=168172 RepID=UPI0020073F5A|nr:hypothetical protein Pst134EA_000695 [Puccinia striiformis f. sp. tritici]KAH9473614.1 hypothetical protein Pst134EA_000695 [Puccinia striiformis f. sp. tritici]